MATNTRSSRPLRLENLEGRLTPASASPMQWPIGEVQQAPVSRDVVFVDELPHTATGKLLKTKLREQLIHYVLPGL